MKRKIYTTVNTTFLLSKLVWLTVVYGNSQNSFNIHYLQCALKNPHSCIQDFNRRCWGMWAKWFLQTVPKKKIDIIKKKKHPIGQFCFLALYGWITSLSPTIFTDNICASKFSIMYFFTLCYQSCVQPCLAPLLVPSEAHFPSLFLYIISIYSHIFHHLYNVYPSSLHSPDSLHISLVSPPTHKNEYMYDSLYL